ncbi:hypothetical protein F5050DRAFT_1898748 [Lentinula boryana]|uniref:Uncharacterized protein n=1 Tax=Lentinula boryana TaxID=40481 RepID=A0ABQ8PX02_9AGAR|nr:hypothetical protein F5050DRAFT_1898748 [Lentinula boryana]
MRIIDRRRTLKKIMNDSILYRVKMAAPSFEFTVKSSSKSQLNHRLRKYFKSKGVKLVAKTVVQAMDWSNLEKADLVYYQQIAGQVFVSKGLFHVVEHLQPHPETLSPSSISSLVEGLLIELGQSGGSITAEKMQVVVMASMQDFGHIFRRWQPLTGFEGTAEEAQELSKRIFFNDFLFSLPTSEEDLTGISKKRGLEEEHESPGRQSPLKRAKLDNVTSKSNLFQRIKRKRVIQRSV